MRLLLPTILLSAAAATAQPTLIVSTNMPVAGLSNTLYRTSSATPGAAGPNVIWDFTTLTHSATATGIYAACPGGPDCSTFPTATLSGYEVVTNGTAYYNTSGSALTVVGGMGNGVTAVFSNPEDYLRFPMTYNSSFNDTMRTSFTQFGQPFTRSGVSTVTADGWGTLKMPGGLTFNNVLRVKRTSTYTDSTNGVQFSIANVTAYSWYSTAHKEFLLFIAQISVPGSGTGTTVAYTLPGLAGIYDAAGASAFSATPNPARDRLTVRWAPGAEVRLALQDPAGRTVAQASGRGGASLDVSGLPRGLYLLQVADGNGAVSTQKVSLR